MDIEEKIAELLEEWGYATVEELANELPLSKERVRRILEDNPDYEEDDNGEWSIV